jgi:hypothetical protein
MLTATAIATVEDINASSSFLTGYQVRLYLGDSQSSLITGAQAALDLAASKVS